MFKIIITFHEGAALPDYILSSKTRELCIFYKLPSKDNPYFENYIFRDERIVPSRLGNLEWVGHLTYSFHKKILVYNFVHLKKLITTSGCDMFIFKILPIDDIYKHSEEFHPGFLNLWEKLIMKMGLGDYKEYGMPKAFFCNYWVMKASHYVDYRDFALKAMNLLDSDEELKKLAYTDANYNSGSHKLDNKRLLELVGREYYTFHPFIMERLVCFYAHYKKLCVMCPNITLIPIEQRYQTPLLALGNVI